MGVRGLWFFLPLFLGTGTPPVRTDRMLVAAVLLSAAPASVLVLNGPRPLPALSRIGATRTPPLQRSMITRRSPGGTMTLALPACSSAGFAWVAAAGGCTAVGLQLGLQSIFDRSSDNILSKAAGVNAHSAIAAMFCIFVTAFGCIGWFNPPAAFVATAATRLLTPIDSVRWLAAFGFGVIGFWDIPTCFAVPDLRKPSFLIHHFAMAAVASCGLVLPSYYAFFFLGVVEASSIPLSIYEGLERAYDVASEADECAPERCCGRHQSLT